MSAVDLPRKHHFVLPQPMGWEGYGQVCEMRLINGKVVPKCKHPQNTGCIKDLYRTKGVPEAISQDLEIKFMGPLDTEAATALRKLISSTALDLSERTAWARFLLSLLYHNRECVDFLRTPEKSANDLESLMGINRVVLYQNTNLISIQPAPAGTPSVAWPAGLLVIAPNNYQFDNGEVIPMLQEGFYALWADNGSSFDGGSVIVYQSNVMLLMASLPRACGYGTSDESLTTTQQIAVARVRPLWLRAVPACELRGGKKLKRLNTACNHVWASSFRPDSGARDKPP
jgi:hypothetical protein